MHGACAKAEGDRASALRGLHRVDLAVLENLDPELRRDARELERELARVNECRGPLVPGAREVGGGAHLARDRVSVEPLTVDPEPGAQRLHLVRLEREVDGAVAFPVAIDTERGYR